MVVSVVSIQLSVHNQQSERNCSTSQVGQEKDP